jgi:SAM-dependent methyltransferase
MVVLGHFERFCKPREYIGVDIEPGKYVDVVLPAERLVDYFGPESFDVVVSTEVIEHVLDWRLVINNMKVVLRRGGFIYLTTRSRGFPYHAYPHDYWRYEPSDMVRIFRDFEIIRLEADWEEPGVFLKARKPMNWTPIDLSGIALYSVVLGRRTKELVTLGGAPLVRRLVLYLCGSRLRWLLPGAMVRVLGGRCCS